MRSVVMVGMVTLAACDPGFTLQGTIADSDSRPLANAVVRLDCDGTVVAETRSDARGKFSERRLGAFPSTCVIEAVRQDTKRSATWPMMAACTKALAPLSPFAPVAQFALELRRPSSGACVEVTANLRWP
jgi:hypothetical protein